MTTPEKIVSRLGPQAPAPYWTDEALAERIENGTEYQREEALLAAMVPAASRQAAVQTAMSMACVYHDDGYIEERMTLVEALRQVVCAETWALTAERQS